MSIKLVENIKIDWARTKEDTIRVNTESLSIKSYLGEDKRLNKILLLIIFNRRD